MNSSEAFNFHSRSRSPIIDFSDLSPEKNSILTEVLSGLEKNQKRLPCKLLYDEHGSEVFTRICDLPEYYPTRTEFSILENAREDICSAIGHDCYFIELGSGDSRKIRVLLDTMRNPSGYMAIDVSKNFMLESASHLAADYPFLPVSAVCADYTQLPVIQLPREANQQRLVAFFPGSSIGNFEPDEAVQFLVQLKNLLRVGDVVLVGADLRKRTEMLFAAYNDKEGVTAEFNLNLLARLNRETGADFNLELFEHRAFFHKTLSRVEMHLVSLVPQTVHIADHAFHFRSGETIHTENSYKYSLEGFKSLAFSAGYKVSHIWMDDKKLFSLQMLELVR